MIERRLRNQCTPLQDCELRLLYGRIIGTETVTVILLCKELNSKSTFEMLICTEEGFNRPVLKHGPRSLTCMRVNRVKKPVMQNESKTMVGNASSGV